MIRVHATCVAIDGRAVLLLGPPGSGKSDLALRLIDRGAVLVADDQVELTRVGDGVFAAAPATIAGLIEVRGVGIVEQPAVAGVPVAMAFDLAALPERLPEPTTREFAGVALPVVALVAFDASAALKVEAALTRPVIGVEAPPVAPAEPTSGTDRVLPARMLVVTGMSGAGKSTALKALEDLGYEAVDNLPLALFDTLIERDEPSDRPLAFGIDSRTRGFDAEAIATRVQTLRSEGLDVRLLFLDCAGGELTRRFSETRRRHPLALDRPAADAVEE
jgi:Ni2+-binding GTPase involved in maturation of urease and hydrogenase